MRLMNARVLLLLICTEYRWVSLTANPWVLAQLLEPSVLAISV